jgi:hypothetical protein
MHRLLIALIAFFSLNILHAAEVNNLYQSQTAVQSRDEGERSEKAPILLREVIVKVVGNRGLVDSTDLTDILSHANDYVVKYGYHVTNAGSTDLTEPEALAVELFFDDTAVNQAIKSAGLPIWGRTRPEILIWLGVEQNGERRVVGSDDVPVDIATALKMAADKRGLSFLLPVMDLQEQTQIHFEDIAQQQVNAIQTLSNRYGAPIVVSVHMKDQGPSSQADWLANGQAFNFQWQSQGDLQTVFFEGLALLADKMSMNYSQSIDRHHAQALLMQVSNIKNYADYHRLLAYLDKLDLIDSVEVNEINGEQVSLALNYFGSEQVLLRTFMVEQLLEESEVGSFIAIKQYRLVP